MPEDRTGRAAGQGGWRRGGRVVALAGAVSACCATVGLTLATGSAESSAARASAAALSSHEVEELRRDDRGLYVAFCPAGEEAARTAAMPPRARAETQAQAKVAEANHAGWPEDECLVRQTAIVGSGDTGYVLSMIALPGGGSFAEGTSMITAIASWAQRHLPIVAAPPASCPSR